MAKRMDENGVAYPKYRENPWLKELAEASRRKNQIIMSNDKDKMAFIGDKPVDGQINNLEALGGAGFFSRKTVEANKFVKMYVAGISEVIGLSKAGSRVFVYLFNEVSEAQVNGTSVILQYNRIVEDDRYNMSNGKPMSRATFMSGIKDLIAHKFIAQSTIPNLYFFNPLYMFNGNRLLVVKEFIKARQETSSEALTAPSSEKKPKLV